MAHSPSDLLTLIDAYAAAAAHREASRDAAGWAFAAAHRQLLAAREAAAAALGIPACQLPALDDDTTRLAQDAIAADDAWRARVDATLRGAL